MNIELKAVKIHEDMSDETSCFSASIFIDGRKVGVVSNQGQGGPNEYMVPDKAAWDKFSAYCKQKMSGSEFQFEYEDQYIDKLLSEHENRMFLRKQCLGKTLFRLDGDTDDSWRVAKIPFTECIRQILQLRYLGRTLIIANDLI